MKKLHIYLVLLALTAFLTFFAACGEGTAVSLYDDGAMRLIEEAITDVEGSIRDCFVNIGDDCPNISIHETPSSSSEPPPPPPPPSSSSVAPNPGTSSQSTGGTSSAVSSSSQASSSSTGNNTQSSSSTGGSSSSTGGSSSSQGNTQQSSSSQGNTGGGSIDINTTTWQGPLTGSVNFTCSEQVGVACYADPAEEVVLTCGANKPIIGAWANSGSGAYIGNCSNGSGGGGSLACTIPSGKKIFCKNNSSQQQNK